MSESGCALCDEGAAETYCDICATSKICSDCYWICNRCEQKVCIPCVYECKKCDIHLCEYCFGKHKCRKSKKTN